MPRETYHESYRFLKTAERLSFQEIVRLARLFVQLGVHKLRITGGEPLLRANLADLIGDLTSIPGVTDVALTTNGMLLAKCASELKAAGLKRVTVSLDSLDPALFTRMSGGFGGVEEVLDGIDHARRAGLAPIKVNALSRRASTTTARSHWSSTSATRTWSCASSSTWTSAIATRGVPITWSPRAISLPPSRLGGRSGRLGAATLERWPSATLSPTAAARSGSFPR